MARVYNYNMCTEFKTLCGMFDAVTVFVKVKVKVKVTFLGTKVPWYESSIIPNFALFARMSTSNIIKNYIYQTKRIWHQSIRHSE